jgi:hypothetical protein
MDTLNRSLECGVVRVLEEQIWLDRRESASFLIGPKRDGGFRQWLRAFVARMQLGPLPDGEPWLDCPGQDRF